VEYKHKIYVDKNEIRFTRAAFVMEREDIDNAESGIWDGLKRNI
jgi:hypothetical protein